MGAIWKTLIAGLQLIEPLAWEVFWRKTQQQKRKRGSFRLFGLFGILMYMIGIPFVSSHIKNGTVLTYNLNNLTYVLFFIYAVWFYEVSKSEVFVCLAAKFTVECLSEFILTFILIDLFQINLQTLTQTNAMRFLAIALLQVLGIAFLFLLYKIKKKYGEALVSRKVFYLILIGLVANIPSFGLAFCVANTGGLSLFNLGTVMVVIFEISILVYVVSTLNYKNKESEYLDVIEFTKKQLQMLQVTQEEIEESRKKLHDVTNHLCTIQVMADREMTTEISEYVSKLIPEVKKGRVSDISNTVLCIVLFEKKARAKKEGISLDCILGVEDIRLPMLELNAIVTNMLDNAIEACMQINNKREKRIEFRTYLSGDNLLMECRNPYVYEPKVDQNGTFITSKFDKQSHGKGMSIIHEYVTKNGGDVEVRCQDSEFFMQIVLSNEIALE